MKVSIGVKELFPPVHSFFPFIFVIKNGRFINPRIFHCKSIVRKNVCKGVVLILFFSFENRLRFILSFYQPPKRMFFMEDGKRLTALLFNLMFFLLPRYFLLDFIRSSLFPSESLFF